MSDSSSTDHISADVPGIHGTSHEFADLTDAEIFNAHQGGKIATTSRLNLETIRDLSIAYTPGVARVCEAIHEDPSLAHHYTWAGRNVAIITDGTAVLGLGDIGPQAALPVMEGKAQLFQRFVGLNGVPIVLDTTNVDEMFDTICRIAPSFGAINLEDISAYFDSYLYADTILSFIRWIKEYNLTCDEKVSVWGFDINFVQLKSRIDLFNYFYSLNAGKHIKELDTVCELLLDTNIPFEKILLMFDECPDLADALNGDELKLMLHCIKITQQNSSSYYRFINRDNMMNEVTTFIIDNFGKKNKTITLYGHFGHLNYINGQGPIVMNYYSLGHYMKNKYKDDYACVALITNQGSAMLIKSYTEMEISTLSSAPQGSLEYQLNRFKEDSVYLSMNNLDCSNILKLRLIGNKELTEQFRYIAPKARMDGVLFIKESQSISKGNANQNKKINYNFVIMNAFQEALKKIKNK